MTRLDHRMQVCLCMYMAMPMSYASRAHLLPSRSVRGRTCLC